jgi:hypothetical protein
MTASWTPTIDPATGQPIYIEPMVKQVPYGYQQPIPQQQYQQMQPPQQQYAQTQGQYMPPQSNQFNQPQQQPQQQQDNAGVSDIVDKFIGMYGVEKTTEILTAALNIAKAKRLKP